MCVGKSFKPNGELCITATHDVLNFKILQFIKQGRNLSVKSLHLNEKRKKAGQEKKLNN